MVRGYVDPLVTDGGFLQIARERRIEVNAELSRLVASGNILRIKIWPPTAPSFSDLPAVRSRQVPVGSELGESLEGSVATEFSSATADENVYEPGLAARFLEIYLPIRATGGNEVLGAYEIYQDAGPIESDIAATRQDVLLIVGAMALLLLGLLFAAFSGTSRLLAHQNRRLRTSDERFRSLGRNSVEVNLIVAADGTITYESPAAERVLGLRADERIGQQAQRGVTAHGLAGAARHGICPGGKPKSQAWRPICV